MFLSLDPAQNELAGPGRPLIFFGSKLTIPDQAEPTKETDNPYSCRIISKTQTWWVGLVEVAGRVWLHLSIPTQNIYVQFSEYMVFVLPLYYTFGGRVYQILRFYKIAYFINGLSNLEIYNFYGQYKVFFGLTVLIVYNKFKFE